MNPSNGDFRDSGSAQAVVTAYIWHVYAINVWSTQIYVVSSKKRVYQQQSFKVSTPI